jgi:hypothetical protein
MRGSPDPCSDATPPPPRNSARTTGPNQPDDRGLVREDADHVAHRSRRSVEVGRSRSITDLAEQEGVTDAYVCRLLPLTCLAPDIVEAILDGRQPKGMRLAEMLGNGPLDWNEQRRLWGFSRKPPP